MSTWIQRVMIAGAILGSLNSGRAWASDQPQFLVKLDRFARQFRARLTREWWPQIETKFAPAERARLRVELDLALAGTDRWSAELERLYRCQFLGAEGPGSAKELEDAEVNLAVRADWILRGAADVLTTGRASAFGRAVRKSLRDGKASRSVIDDWRMNAPLTRSTASVARATLFDLGIRNRSVLDVYQNPGLTEKVFKPDTTVSTSRPIKDFAFEDNAVVFAVMNHDVALVEAALMARISNELPAAEKFIIVLRSAYPHLRIHKNPDPRVLEYEDKQMVTRLLRRIGETPGLVTVGVFPEGARSGFAAQIPLATKPGVPVLALRTAQKSKRPTYILPLRYEALRYMTTDSTDIHIEVGDLIRVPVTKEKGEVERLRREIEDFIGFERGRSLVDLKAPGFVAGTWGVYRTTCARDLE